MIIPSPLPVLRIVVVSVVALFLLYIPGCVSSRADAQEQDVSRLQDESASLSGNALITATEDLSDEAKSVYVFLLCDQAFRNEDEAALFEAVPLLQELRAPVQAWMEAGIWLLGRKSENAEFFLRIAREIWPKDTSLLLLYAEALKEKDQIDQAVTLLKDYLKEEPHSSEAKIELALLYVQRKDFETACNLLNSIEKQQRTPHVDLNHGKALAGMQRYEAAIPYLKRAVKGMPDLPETHIELGLVYERLGQINQAIRAYEGALQTDFPAKNILLRLISLELQQKHPEKAMRYLESAPADIPFQLICADLFIDYKHYLQATNILTPIVARNDCPVEAYLLLADLTWEHLRDLSRALGWLDKMPEAYQKSSSAILLRTHLLAKAGKTAEALEMAHKGKELFSNETKFWEAEARILTVDKKVQEALSVMREAVKKWPADMNLLFLMANILDESGDKKAAMKLMEQIVERQPDNFQALNYIGYTLAEANRDIDRAVDLLERACKLAPDRAYILDSLAWAYYRANRLDDALREIRRAVALSTALDPAIWEHYGDIAQRLGLPEEARNAYAKALEMHPTNADLLQEKLSKLGRLAH